MDSFTKSHATKSLFNINLIGTIPDPMQFMPDYTASIVQQERVKNYLKVLDINNVKLTFSIDKELVSSYLSLNKKFLECLNQPISITPALKEKLLNELLNISEGLEAFDNTIMKRSGLFPTPKPISKNTKDELKKLLQRDKRKEAFEELAPLVSQQTTKENELLLLQNRQYKLENQRHQGVISKEAADLEGNQIMAAILVFIEKL